MKKEILKLLSVLMVTVLVLAALAGCVAAPSEKEVDSKREQETVEAAGGEEETGETEEVETETTVATETTESQDIEITIEDGSDGEVIEEATDGDEIPEVNEGQEEEPAV